MSDEKQFSNWLRLENSLILLVALLGYHALQASWLMLAALILIPDLSMLGYLLSKRAGACIYNIAHSYAVPAVLVIWSQFAGDLLLELAIIWIAHIAADRALGFGLKSTTGFRITHLGYVGKPNQS